MILLDTDVLIDCLRGLPSADEWLHKSSDQSFAIPGIVAMELVARYLQALPQVEGRV